MLDNDDLIQAAAELGYEPDEMMWLDSGPGTDSNVLAIPLTTGDDWFVQWEQFRNLVETSGRWPVACESLRPDPVDASRDIRFFFNDKASTAASILAAAADLNPDRVFDDHQPRIPDGDDPLSLLSTLMVDSDTKQRWRAEAAESIDCSSGREVERFLVRKQIEEQNRYPLAKQGEWGDLGAEPGSVLLIPDNDPVNGLAYAAAFDTPAIEALPVARRWAQHHSVEVVASVSCSTLFQMPAPVADPDQAWRMGIELRSLWSCSFGGGVRAGLDALHFGCELAANTRFDGTLHG